MKSILISACCVALMASCAGNGKPQGSYDTAVTLLYDLTDTMKSKPTGSMVSGFFTELRSDNLLGAKFRILPITDIEHNPATELRMEPARLLATDLPARKVAVAAFLRCVESCVDSITALPHGRESSSIYAAVAREAEALKASVAVRKVLLVYSDLRENGFLNLHSTEGLNDVKRDRKRIIEMLQQRFPLPDISGVEVHLVYEASDYDDSEAFHSISELYKEIFESHGATVYIQANANP